MDWETAKTVALITFGHAIGGAILSAWYHWKARRTDLRMVRNRKGVYVDAADVFERRALIGLAVFVLGILAANAIIFINMP